MKLVRACFLHFRCCCGAHGILPVPMPDLFACCVPQYYCYCTRVCYLAFLHHNPVVCLSVGSAAISALRLWVGALAVRCGFLGIRSCCASWFVVSILSSLWLIVMPCFSVSPLACISFGFVSAPLAPRAVKKCQPVLPIHTLSSFLCRVAAPIHSL